MRFESSNSTYGCELTNISGNALIFYKKTLKGLSKTLNDAVSEAIRLIEQTQQATTEEKELSQ